MLREIIRAAVGSFTLAAVACGEAVLAGSSDASTDLVPYDAAAALEARSGVSSSSSSPSGGGLSSDLNNPGNSTLVLCPTECSGDSDCANCIERNRCASGICGAAGLLTPDSGDDAQRETGQREVISDAESDDADTGAPDADGCACTLSYQRCDRPDFCGCCGPFDRCSGSGTCVPILN